MRSVIMCVDDDKYILHTLYEQLNGWFGKDYIIAKEESAEAALKTLERFIEEKVTISVVISDYIMPGMRGDEFLKNVYDLKSSIKTIMLTGHSAIDGVVYAINNAGLYRFIAKPWDPKDLRLTITEAAKAFEQGQVMSRLYEDSKAFYTQYADSTRNLRQSCDKALTTIIGATENIFDKLRPTGYATHCLAVKFYAGELIKAQGVSDNAVFEAGFAGLSHEIGKYTITEAELDDLDVARRDTNYADSAAAKLLERTLALAEGFGADYAKTLKGLYKKYNPDLPLNTRVLAIANMFDNFMVIKKGDEDAARQELLKYAAVGYLDPDLTRVFVKDVPLYKGNNDE